MKMAMHELYVTLLCVSLLRSVPAQVCSGFGSCNDLCKCLADTYSGSSFVGGAVLQCNIECVTCDSWSGTCPVDQTRIRRTKATTSPASACCYALCATHTCPAAWVAKDALTQCSGACSDSECCLPTCASYDCGDRLPRPNASLLTMTTETFSECKDGTDSYCNDYCCIDSCATKDCPEHTVKTNASRELPWPSCCALETSLRLENTTPHYIAVELYEASKDGFLQTAPLDETCSKYLKKKGAMSRAALPDAVFSRYSSASALYETPVPFFFPGVASITGECYRTGGRVFVSYKVMCNTTHAIHAYYSDTRCSWVEYVHIQKMGCNTDDAFSKTLWSNGGLTNFCYGFNTLFTCQALGQHAMYAKASVFPADCGAIIGEVGVLLDKCVGSVGAYIRRLSLHHSTLRSCKCGKADLDDFCGNGPLAMKADFCGKLDPADFLPSCHFCTSIEKKRHADFCEEEAEGDHVCKDIGPIDAEKCSIRSLTVRSITKYSMCDTECDRRVTYQLYKGANRTYVSPFARPKATTSNTCRKTDFVLIAVVVAAAWM